MQQVQDKSAVGYEAGTTKCHCFIMGKNRHVSGRLTTTIFTDNIVSFNLVVDTKVEAHESTKSFSKGYGLYWHIPQLIIQCALYRTVHGLDACLEPYVIENACIVAPHRHFPSPSL